MVCCGFDPERVRQTIRAGLADFQRHRCPVEINLKDVKTVQGEPDRLRRFVDICREEIDAS